MRGAKAVLLVAALAAALQPPKRTPVRRTNLSASPDAVAIDEGRVVGEGSYGVVVAAIDENNKQYVAKRARKDDRSKRYFEVERTINEKLRGTPGLAPYRGVVEGPTPEKQFFDPPTTKYLLFDRVKGGRDAETYLNDGSCGVDGLAAALGLDACAYGDEVCFVDNEEECTADPQQARSGAANVVVASVVLSFLLDACAALEANKVIHRDVKASNILVEPSQKRLVLIDFGSAMDVDTKQGYEARKSPVSPRYCPPEQFVELEHWRAFDAYGCGLVALRLLLSPALRSANDVDAFNIEFAAAGHDLDKWLSTKLAQTALPERLLAPLSALRSLKSGAALWRLVSRLLAEDPRRRRTAKDAKVEASKLQEALLDEASNMEAATAVPPRARDPALIPSRRRYALQAPLGLIVEEDGGVRVSSVTPGSNSAKLGAPRVGDLLLSVEYVPKGADEPVFEDLELKKSFEAALSTLEGVPQQRMIEVVVERESSGGDDALTVDAPVAQIRLGAYRRRGSSRAAMEDCVAVGSDDSSEILNGRDWPAREPSEEITTELSVTHGRAVACAVDGHGGQEASRHAADRLPGLVASFSTKSPEAALKAAWVRCAEELELDGPGGVVAACCCVDLEAQTISLLHCGDARAVVVSSSQPAAAYETSDHTLKLASERAALENRGGAARGGRVLADQWAVAVPRALGGKVWRAAGISPAPDVATLACGGADGLVLASDGLWDVLSSDDAAAFVRANRLFRPERSAAQVAAALASRAAALGSTDDVSVVCVFFDR